MNLIPDTESVQRHADRLPFRIAIVGGGPNATYSLERLAALFEAGDLRRPLDVTIFDKSGRFGDGAVHDASQPRTSLLLRIANETSVAADWRAGETTPRLPAPHGQTMFEWAKARADEHPDFVMDKETHPARYLHGVALREAFENYRSILLAHGCQVETLVAEVVDIVEDGRSLGLLTEHGDRIAADHVLCVTGHGVPRFTADQERLRAFASRTGLSYVPRPYPLPEFITEETVRAGSRVAIRGMGVTAIDQILWLTEGRGGRFETQQDGRLAYLPSGREPSSIVPFSPSGLFMGCLPYPAKHTKGTPHAGHFWTHAAVDRIRDRSGEPVEREPGVARLRLDFDRDLMPVVVLEMADLYYRTLLGPDFGDWFRTKATPTYDAFVADTQRKRQSFDPANDGYERLLDPVAADLRNAAALFDRALAGHIALTDATDAARSQGWSLAPALARFLAVVFGEDAAPRLLSALDAGQAPDLPASPHALPARLADSLFSWRSLIQPIADNDMASPDSYQKAVAEFLRKDVLWGAQGDAANPVKVVARSVWREQMKVFAHAVNDAGLTAAAHKRLLRRAKRYRSQLAVGSPLSAMQRIEALVRHGLVDVSAGPEARIDTGPDNSFVVEGPRTGARITVDTVVEGHLRAFDASTEAQPLYANLLERGLVRKWRNWSADGDHFEPGGLDIDEFHRAVRPDGSVDARLAFRGWPTEGQHYLQTGLYRPHLLHHVLADAIAWSQGLLHLIATDSAAAADHSDTPADIERASA